MSRAGDELISEMREGQSEAQRHASRYFLGHKRIEQHLVEFPGGKLQALPIGWDLGRGEWFDIFAGDPRAPEDWGHWTNRGMIANTQCIACHTTGFERGYDPAGDAYHTRWAEIAVGCEACHGPRSAHVEERRAAGRTAPPSRAEPKSVVGIPSQSPVMEMCAPCHALRRELLTGHEPGKPFLDFYEPILIDDGRQYHPDGQVRGESYEWASFLQSRMARESVTCVSCHDPHSGTLLREGNALCLGCHEKRLGQAEHVRHAPDSPGAQCAGCHMPVTVFMTRDPRHDHSFSLPDPQMTIDLGVPNACNACHTDREPAWAAELVHEWYGTNPRRADRRALAKAFVRGRGREPESAATLAACLIGAACEDEVRRASAARLLAPLTEKPDVLDALLAAAEPSQASALIRASAMWALSEQADPSRAVLLALQSGTKDSVRLARMNAAWGLRGIPTDSMPESMREPLRAAREEWRTAMETQAEHPEVQQTLGAFFAEQRDFPRAEESYRAALRLAPQSVQTRHNLALLLIERGDRAGAERELAEVRRTAPGFAPATYALGVLHGEAGRWREAVAAFTDCLRSDPFYPDALRAIGHAYVQLGAIDVGTLVLEGAVRYPGAEREARRALVAFNLEVGEEEEARRWAREAVANGDDEIASDPQVQALLRDDTD